MLRKTGIGWEFEHESLLEDCLQRHLQALLSLQVIAQQYVMHGQICDLLGVSETRQLSILELKNQEDRYIVQQLTRYFDACLAEKPFADVVDYSQPIRLLAIAPSFHRDNFIDRKYSQLQIEFLTVEIEPTGAGYSLNLRHLDTEKCSTINLPETFLPTSQEVGSPPKSLLSLLSKCPEVDRDGFLKVRYQLLSFDQRIREIASPSSVLYGNGKSNSCAEVRYDSKRLRAAVFLWLPHTASFRGRDIVARLRIWTDWQIVSDLAHVPKALGRTITVQEWLEGKIKPLNKVVPKSTWLKTRFDNDEVWRLKYINAHRGSTNVAHYRSGIAMTFDGYRKVIQQPDLSNQLTDITQLALGTWLRRVQ